MKKKVAIAISGGIDSLVASFFLKKYNLELFGLKFINGFEKESSLSVVKKMKLISDQLKIPIKIIDLRSKFKSIVIDYFVKDYCKGYTPNPCYVCNCKIKFGLLMKIAKRMGASKIATGHYAIIEKVSNEEIYLKRGIDERKDQSYFLSGLKKDQLKEIIFPLGTMTKVQVREEALKYNLETFNDRESQDICFIESKKYRSFINKNIFDAPKSGEIFDIKGKKIGFHKGLHNFTVGQRRGINCPHSEPYYVIKMNRINNSLVVGGKNFLFSSKAIIKNINWIFPTPERAVRANIQIRYRQKPSFGTIVPYGNNSAIISFDIPQMAITPGQIAVFYDGDRVLGSGWIE